MTIQPLAPVRGTGDANGIWQIAFVVGLGIGNRDGCVDPILALQAGKGLT